MRRELMEEVAIDATKEVAVAVINDDSTEVGYVHLGVVHIVQVSNESVAGCRSGIVGPEFVLISEAVKNPSSYESWSSFCLEHLKALLSKAATLESHAPERAVA
jgi:predicted NUDIX family phosphoesterase